MYALKLVLVAASVGSLLNLLAFPFCMNPEKKFALTLIQLITVTVLVRLSLQSATLTKYSTLKPIPVTLAVLRLMFGIQSLANVLHPKIVVTFSVNVNPLLS
ncbi:hypothetical protein DDN00_02415 [Vibrio cholerae]|nr:hypothetical protein [Vibrio cholerae]